MNRVGFLYHPDYLKHDTGQGHPERPERVSSLVSHLLKTREWHLLQHFQPRMAEIKEIALVHPESHVLSIEKRCASGETVLDQGDTHVCPDSFKSALRAAGAGLEGIDRIVRNELQSAFCAVRPPGHHAETATAMGFCLFNNVAIGARYAQRQHGIGRVAIVDWDVHHGNGTQEIFYDDPSVLYISLHQYPFYPGTGAATERGRGTGEGYTLNCPMRAGSGQAEYIKAFQERIVPALNEFKPELLMISAGFDAHEDDPLAGIALKEESFSIMTQMVMDVAEEHCGGRIISMLEGGYDLSALARSVEVHLRKLLG